MERLPRHELPTQEPDSDKDNNSCSPDSLLSAKKVHKQLTDLIIELASLTFDKIGSLREDCEGNFFISEYIAPNNTTFPEQRAIAFKSLESKYRGPYSTVSEFYHATCLPGKAHAQTDPDEVSPEEAIEDFETLNQMIPKVRLNEYKHGPFVLLHDDPTVQNILVDHEFNITGIIDFPCMIAPV